MKQYILAIYFLLLIILQSMFLPVFAETRGLMVCVANNAPPEVKSAAQKLLTKVQEHSLLKIMSGGNPLAQTTDSLSLSSAAPEARAYNHLILIGLADDPMIRAAWQREALIENQDIYVFGFGHFHNSIGYIESDRNPFLHAAAVKSTPFETEVLTLTGTTPQGVAAAVDAFLEQKLVGGIIACPNWSRSAPSLLQRDPLLPGFKLPGWIQEKISNADLIGVIQASESEYRGVLADTGVKPQEIWRLKYYVPGSWDTAGLDHAFDQYSSGLHRRAYGNSLWLARFSTPAQASQAAPKIASAAHLQKQGEAWAGGQPPYSWGTTSPGPLKLWQKGEWVLMSTLP